MKILTLRVEKYFMYVLIYMIFLRLISVSYRLRKHLMELFIYLGISLFRFIHGLIYTV